MSRLIYTILYALLTPIFFLRLAYRGKTSDQALVLATQRKNRFLERLGIFSLPDSFPQQHRPIWFHCVSVGEFLATQPLIKRLQQKHPEIPIVITSTTATGSERVLQAYQSEPLVLHVYLPYDLPFAINNFLTRINPQKALVMETEIWPNLYHCVQQHQIPLWLLNARLSARSAKGYARFAKLTKETLNCLTGITTQTSTDAERLVELGAPEQKVFTTGSIKFDLTLSEEQRVTGEALRQYIDWQHCDVLIAASTHAGEDEQLLNVYEELKKQHQQIKLIVVPRHPDRFNSVFELLKRSTFAVQKRSDIQAQETDILLGDTMGEMMSYFAMSDIAFVGGSLVETGGHNILEPAALGLPVLFGPHMFNFQQISELFLQQGAASQVSSKEELAKRVSMLICENHTRVEMGERGEKIVQENAGAIDKILSLI